MAPFVLRNAAVRINNVLVSDHTTDVAVNMTAAEGDTTAMTAGGRQRIQGIRDDSFAITALSDFAASSIDETIWPLFNSGTSLFLVEVWANGTTSSATNPKYSGTCILLEYTPIAGAVGDVSKTPLTMPVNGVISRATT